MKVYIAEKPSLGRALAEVLPKPHQREDGFIRLGNGDCVTWCIGHLLELAEPHDYDENFRKWRFEALPIVPEQWQLKAKTSGRKQLGVLKNLLKQASSIVHAGDPDREGQLLVDEVIHHLGVKGEKLKTVQRVLINDLNPSAVQTALTQLQPNRNFAALSTSALARSRADWLYGINMTRAYSLLGQKKGYEGVLSVGRVQTPVLGLVVRRDLEIDDFVSIPYYEVRAFIHPPQQPDLLFFARWQPSEACAPYCDDEGRVLSEALAQNVVKRIANQPAHLTKWLKQHKRIPPPLPYSLSTLQIDAANQLRLSAQQVLDVCQSLYEHHKLITYPRSDSRYLPLEQWGQASAVMQAIAHNLPSAAEAVTKADLALKNKCWNSAKVEAHHAIIPTQKRLDTQRLTSQELALYRLICRQYLIQFYPSYEYHSIRMEFLIAGGLFLAQGREPIQLGWKQLFPAAKKDGDTKSDDEKSGEPLQTLPKITQGETCCCVRGELLSKQTQPPKYFTDATLMAAMTGINRFVQDPELKKILKDTDGIGTEATRASIVELLFKRQFLLRDGKNIRATHSGKALIAALPDVATRPDMTANWELSLAAIHRQQLVYQDFMTPLTGQLQSLIEQSQFSQFVQSQAGNRGTKTNTGVDYKKGKSNKTAAANKTGAFSKTNRDKTGTAVKQAAAGKTRTTRANPTFRTRPAATTKKAKRAEPD